MSQSLDKSVLTEEKKENSLAAHSLHDQYFITNKTDLRVLEALKEYQPATRMELCDKTGIARTTLYDALTRLMVKRIVVKYTPPVKTKGRPKVFYRTVSE
jgi:predicted transcriptional regulator